MTFLTKVTGKMDIGLLSFYNHVNLLVFLCVYACANCVTMVGVSQVLLGSVGLKSANFLEQQAAISTLSTMMSIIPGDTYIEFEKVFELFCYPHFDSLLDWSL